MGKIRFLLPGDLDTSGAPPADVYFDGRLGDDSFDGTSPVPMTGSIGPKRTGSALPSVIAAGATAALRDDNVYGPAAMPISDTPAGPQVQFNGSVGNVATIKGWGSKSASVTPDAWTGLLYYAAITGTTPTKSYWGAVTESLGNAYLAANGEQAAGTFPAWFTFFHVPAEGRESYCPAYWNPGISDTLGDLSRREWFTPFEGAEGAYIPATVQLGFPTAPSGGSFPAIVRDATKELSFSAPGGAESDVTGEVTYYWRHPKFAEFFGADGPVGCMISCQSDPSNATRWTTIDSYDEALSEIVFRFPRSGANRVRVGSSYNTVTFEITPGYMMLVGVPQAIKQPGQFGYRFNGAGVEPDYWLVKAPWMTGGRRHAVLRTVFNYLGSHGVVEKLTFSQAVGVESSAVVGQLLALTGAADNITFRDFELAWHHSNNGRQVDVTSGTAASCLFENFFSHSSPCQGGITFSVFPDSTIDGAYFTENGGTSIAQNTTATTPTNTTIVNVTSAHVWSVHGNFISLYDNTNNAVVDKCLSYDRTLPGTVQSEGSAGASVAVPLNRTIRNTLFQQARPIKLSALDVNERYSGDALRLGWGWTNSLVDQCWAPRGGRAGLFVGVAGTANLQVQFDDGVVRRSAFDGISMSSGRGTPTNGGLPLAFVDVLSTGASSSANLPAEWASPGGATVTRSDFEDLGKYAGAPRLEEWERMTRVVGFNPVSPAYAPMQIGPDWIDWIWPAWNPALSEVNQDPGAPVPLKLSRYWFNANSQPGKALCGVLRARPGSTLAIDPAFGSGASLFLDIGLVINTTRFSSSIRFAVTETTMRGLSLRTEFELTVRK
jgi:hypothetical protein